jgi:large subunit ribosomal protein L11
MAEQIVDAVVEGGKASAAPPLGPALGPLKINIAQVVAAINEKTKDLAGMKVPVKVIVDTKTKQFKIEVGKPPASAMILKEIGIDKGCGTAGKDRIGDLSEEQVKKIARAKFGFDGPNYANQIKGTCRSMGVSIGLGKVTDEERSAAEQHRKEAAEKKEAPKAEAAGDAAAPAEGAAPAAEKQPKPAKPRMQKKGK